MIPLAVPNLSGREADYLQECVTSTFVSSVGQFVTRMEQQAAEASCSVGGVAVSAGTTGLHLALRTLGVLPGDLVVLPAFTFVASANAIAHCHATPWLFDVEGESWTLSAPQVKRVLNDRLIPAGADRPRDRVTGARVGAIMPVHTLGHPADMQPLLATAARFGIPVVADAAAALGATYRGRAIGELGADFSVFSFNGNKTVTAGGGGMVVSQDRALLDRARHLSTTARIGDEYEHDEVGFNYRMTNLQAAVGCAQLEQLDRFVTIKRRIQAHYTEQLTDLPGVEPFPQADWADSAAWFAGVVVKDRPYDRLQTLRAELRQAGIDARPFWKPMHLQRPYAAAPREDLSVTDGFWPQLLTLPCSTSINQDDLAYVTATVRERLRRS